MKAWLGLGANLQQPAEKLRQALNNLGEVEEIEILNLSSFYRTPPWGDQEQADFINAVVQIETSLDAIALLRLCQSVENVMGRRRSDRRWGPRLIDIDLLLYGDQKFQSDDLELPHPRMHERAFVLMPMSEIDPMLSIPGRGVVVELLKALDCSDIDCLYDEGQD